MLSADAAARRARGSLGERRVQRIRQPEIQNAVGHDGHVEVRGDVDDVLRARIAHAVASYRRCASAYLEGRLGGGPRGGAVR